MAGVGVNTTGHDIRGSASGNGYNTRVLNGVYIAEVTNDIDGQHNGRITVKIPELGAKTDHIIMLSTPFGGNTSISDASDDPSAFGDDATSVNGTPKTYGMWPQPPAIGTNVIVAFTASMEQGFFIGALPPRDRNATMGGQASSEAYDGEGNIILSPTGEKNPNDANDPVTKAANPEAVSHLVTSGLAADFVRGHSQSSARRESPSNVFGVTSKAGHTISMDDGTGDGSSNNVRIKTRGGATILMDDTNGFIFITNKGGSGYIEMDSEGRVDIYSQGGVSIATDGDYNVHAKGSINMQAEQGVNIKSSGSEGLKLESSVGSIDIHSSININSSADQAMNLTAKTNYLLKATRVDMNGPPPTAAKKTTVQAQTANSNVVKSAASRVPEHHPWLGASSIQESLETGKGNTG